MLIVGFNQKTGEDLKELLGNEIVTFYVSPYLRSRLTYKYIRQAFLDEQVLPRVAVIACMMHYPTGDVLQGRS